MGTPAEDIADFERNVAAELNRGTGRSNIVQFDSTTDAKESVRADPDLARMNGLYAVVKIGGKTRVMELEESPAHTGSKIPAYSTIHDFKAFHSKQRKDIVGPNGKVVRRLGIGQWWIDHEERRQYSGVVYAPNKDAGDRFNLWIGYGCDAIKGDCDLFLQHVHDVVCGGNSEHSQYLLGWMAYAVQHPGRPGEVAVVLRGREGTGKGQFAKQFGRLFGAHFKHIANGKHLTGNFNAHLQHCSVLFADEALFAGDRSHEPVLKALITEETILIEPKGLDSFSARNCIHLIMASNSEWVVPAGADARRYFVLDVSDAKMQDQQYFEALTQHMANGGLEALLHYLLNLPLADFRVREVPKTAALADQKARTRRGVDQLVERIAHEGVLPSVHTSFANVVITTGEERSEGFYANARKLVPDLKYESSILIANALKPWGCTPWHSGLQRGIKFPPLSELRNTFDQKHGAQNWPDTLDWGHSNS